jgi:hypothetical protein
MMVMGWVALLALQAGDPASPAGMNADTTRSVPGPVDRKLDEPVPDRSRGPRPASTAGGAPARALPATPANVSGLVVVRSELGKRYRLIEASVAIDGDEVARREAPKGQELERSFTAFDGALTPGRHAVSVTLVYEGRNAGVFSYVDNYKFRVQSSYAFDAVGNGPAALNVVARERPGADVPLEKKPTMEISPAPGAGVVPVAVETAAAPASTSR